MTTVVILLERVPVSLRGELTRWMLEPSPGVFIGTMSARVRDKLWVKSCQASKGGACLLVHNAQNEQGFALRLWGAGRRTPEDFDGLALVRIWQ